jgi:hypothetical protein
LGNNLAWPNSFNEGIVALSFKQHAVKFEKKKKELNKPVSKNISKNLALCPFHDGPQLS